LAKHWSELETIRMPERRPLRRITGREYYAHPSTPRGGGSVMLTLECGHEVHCKRSKEPKRKARCYHCPETEEPGGDST